MAAAFTLLRLIGRARCVAFALAASVVVPVAWATQLVDGPYLMSQTAEGWTAWRIAGDDKRLRVRTETIPAGGVVRIDAVGSVPGYEVRLRAEDPIAPDEISLGAEASVFAVGDTHGQYELLVGLLQKHRVIDGKLGWSFGRGHLVLLGDVFDRGPHHTQIFWLLYKLQAEAAAAGGGAHLVLGNHEQLALLGDRADLHLNYLRIVDHLKLPSHAALWSNETFLGSWLRRQATVLKLGDTLCVHGGISRQLVERGETLAQINASVRDGLLNTPPLPGPRLTRAQIAGALLRKRPTATAAERERATFLNGRWGPLWFRGYVKETADETGYPPAPPEDAALACEHFKVKAILRGHCIVPTVTSHFGGRVVSVQVQLRRDDAGKPVGEALLIRGGRMCRARIDGSEEIL